ncbi:MAG: hypothetical protein N0A15_03945 [Anaerolineae bacterium]|nr:hypothetical protein [Anaerolineae bacterium]
MSRQVNTMMYLEAPVLENRGLGALSDLLGDLVLYRRLEPVDRRLPSFQEAWHEMGLPNSQLPRKHELTYAQAVGWLLRLAQEMRGVQQPLQELLYLGDTALLDSTAFRNLVQVTGWQGWAFIANEQLAAPPKIEHQADGITLANRWAAIAEWLNWLLNQQEACLDETTAVVVDIDKTALGARGRNATPIDCARMEGAELVVKQVLGEHLDLTAFRTAYRELNQPDYHAFTADNQDYLAYICLMIGAGMCTLDALKQDIAEGHMVNFEQFIRWMDVRLCRETNVCLIDLHRAIYARFQSGDPTPFKAFRRQEYLATISRMANLPDHAPLEQRLNEEICLTGEIMTAMRWLNRRGVLLLALSDKPDEASLPTPEQAEQGYQALHRKLTHVVGQPVDDWLPR